MLWELRVGWGGRVGVTTESVQKALQRNRFLKRKNVSFDIKTCKNVL